MSALQEKFGVPVNQIYTIKCPRFPRFMIVPKFFTGETIRNRKRKVCIIVAVLFIAFLFVPLPFDQLEETETVDAVAELKLRMQYYHAAKKSIHGKQGKGKPTKSTPLGEFQTYVACLGQAFDILHSPELIAPYFPQLQFECLKMFQIPKLFLVPNRNEWKYAIPARDGPAAGCVLISMGIGGDISAEETLRAIMPQCQMFGADPTPANGLLFKRVGTYFSTAVSTTSGRDVIEVRVPNTDIYQKQMVETTDFSDFIHKKVLPYLKVAAVEERNGKRMAIHIIDHVWIDVKGAEFAIFRKYFVLNDPSMNDVTICQVNVEFHNVPDHVEEFNEVLKQIILLSDFTPFYITDMDLNMRAYFFNYRSSLCFMKYYAS